MTTASIVAELRAAHYVTTPFNIFATLKFLINNRQGDRAGHDWYFALLKTNKRLGERKLDNLTMAGLVLSNANSFTTGFLDYNAHPDATLQAVDKLTRKPPRVNTKLPQAIRK